MQLGKHFGNTVILEGPSCAGRTMSPKVHRAVPLLFVLAEAMPLSSSSHRVGRCQKGDWWKVKAIKAPAAHRNRRNPSVRNWDHVRLPVTRPWAAAENGRADLSFLTNVRYARSRRSWARFGCQFHRLGLVFGQFFRPLFGLKLGNHSIGNFAV